MDAVKGIGPGLSLDTESSKSSSYSAEGEESSNIARIAVIERIAAREYTPRSRIPRERATNQGPIKSSRAGPGHEGPVLCNLFF